MVALVLGDKTAVVLALDLVDDLLRIADDDFLLRRHDDVGDGDRHAGDAGIMVTEVLDAVDDFCRLRRAKVVIAVGNEFAKLFLVHEDAELPLVTALVLMVVTELRRQDLVEDHAAERCAHEAIAFDAAADLRLQLKVVLLISEQCLSDTRDDHALALGAWLEDRQVVGTENHILRRDDDWLAVLRCEDVVGCEHQDARLSLCLGRQRQMDSHLVTIEVGVVGRAGQRMELQCMTFRQDRLEGLDAETMQRRSTVQ